MKRPISPYLRYGKPYLPREPQAKIQQFIPIKDFSIVENGYYDIVLPKNVKRSDIVYNKSWNGYSDDDQAESYCVPGYIVNNANPNYAADMCAYGLAMHNYRLQNDKYKKEMLSYSKRKAAYDKKMISYNEWAKQDRIIKLEKTLKKLKQM